MGSIGNLKLLTYNLAQRESLNEHNKYRTLHCDTPLMTFSQDVADTAQKIADRKVWAHSKSHERNGYGENLAWNTASTIEKAIKQATGQFYNEIEFYNWENPGFSGIGGNVVGHFTQVVWKTSVRVGVGYTRFKMKGWKTEGWLMVFHYDGAGNWLGSFDKNVMPLKSVDNCGLTTTTKVTTTQVTTRPTTGITTEPFTTNIITTPATTKTTTELKTTRSTTAATQSITTPETTTITKPPTTSRLTTTAVITSATESTTQYLTTKPTGTSFTTVVLTLRGLLANLTLSNQSEYRATILIFRNKVCSKKWYCSQYELHTDYKGLTPPLAR